MNCPIATAVASLTAGKRVRRKEARPGELLQAALELFVEKGYAATRAEEVAHRAGVSKGTLFLYFGSKEELFKAVVRDSIASRFPVWNTELETSQVSTADLLRHCMQQWWERVGSTKAAGISKLMMSEATNFPELAEFYRAEVIEPGHSLIRKILQRGVARGEFRPVDPDYGIYLVLAPLMFLTMWQHSFGACLHMQKPIEPVAYINAQIDNILHGLSVRA